MYLKYSPTLLLATNTVTGIIGGGGAFLTFTKRVRGSMAKGWRYSWNKCGWLGEKLQKLGSFANKYAHNGYNIICFLKSLTMGVWGSVESSPSGARGGAPEANNFYAN